MRQNDSYSDKEQDYSNIMGYYNLVNLVYKLRKKGNMASN